MSEQLYIYIPGLFLGTIEQYDETFGQSSFEDIVATTESSVTFTWVADNEAEAFIDRHKDL